MGPQRDVHDCSDLAHTRHYSDFTDEEAEPRVFKLLDQYHTVNK